MDEIYNSLGLLTWSSRSSKDYRDTDSPDAVSTSVLASWLTTTKGLDCIEGLASQDQADRIGFGDAEGLLPRMIGW